MQPQYIEIDSWGDKHYYKDREMKVLHRLDGPACEYVFGDKSWYINGKLHREDGPAVVWADGSRFWWVDGKLHREDGPAVEYISGSKAWCLNGKQLSEEEFRKATAPEVVLTMDEIANKLGIDVSKLKIKK